jgi:hypothetical protein
MNVSVIYNECLMWRLVLDCNAFAIVSTYLFLLCDEGLSVMTFFTVAYLQTSLKIKSEVIIDVLESEVQYVNNYLSPRIADYVIIVNNIFFEGFVINIEK